MHIYATYDRIFSDSHLKDYPISIILLQDIAYDTYFGISANNNSFKTDNINDTHISYL